jgi:hypothetical protein
VEFYKNQIMVVSNEHSIDCIDSYKEQNIAKFHFKISLQAPNCLWKSPKWGTVDTGIAALEEYLIWNWINTVHKKPFYVSWPA